MDSRACTVAVVGAGTMGAGIAQVAAQAGHRVLLHDARDGAASDAKARLAKTLDGQVAKGRLDADAARATLERIEPAAALPALADATLVVEAIVENVDIKRALFAELESLLADDAVLASNTSSISITALGRGLKCPERLVGMHFFNPVPLMKLVEVVSGLRTDRAVADAIFELSKAWGKTPVHARSTPGFIVNRIARPYYAEALALLHERFASPEQIDAALRGAGFRMGPCELMDLIGHDVNYAVTESVYAANYFDKRYVPSLVQKELVDGGMLGRKSGRGFYEYRDGKAVTSTGPLAAKGQGEDSGSITETANLRRTDGRTASQLAADAGTRDIAVFDWALGEPDSALAFALADGASDAFAARAEQAIADAGFAPLRIGDAPGLVVARTVAMLINEAADAVQQGVCDRGAADAAMKLGVNYPAGPFEWLDRIGAGAVIGLLDALARDTCSERYRVSRWLRRRSFARASEETTR